MWVREPSGHSDLCGQLALPFGEKALPSNLQWENCATGYHPLLTACFGVSGAIIPQVKKEKFVKVW